MSYIAGAIIASVLGGPIAYLFGLQRSRQERLEEKRAEVIAELCRLLFEVQDSYWHWSRPGTSLLRADFVSEAVERQAEKGRVAVENKNALIRYHHSNVVWLKPETAAKVESFIDSVQKTTHAYGPDLGDLYSQMSAEGRAVRARMTTEIPDLRKYLIGEFRAILYPKAWWKRLFDRNKRQ